MLIAASTVAIAATAMRLVCPDLLVSFPGAGTSCAKVACANAAASVAIEPARMIRNSVQPKRKAGSLPNASRR